MRSLPNWIIGGLIAIGAIYALSFIMDRHERRCFVNPLMRLGSVMRFVIVSDYTRFSHAAHDQSLF
jgi:hypothetical protein